MKWVLVGMEMQLSKPSVESCYAAIVCAVCRGLAGLLLQDGCWHRYVSALSQAHRPLKRSFPFQQGLASIPTHGLTQHQQAAKCFCSFVSFVRLYYSTQQNNSVHRNLSEQK